MKDRGGEETSRSGRADFGCWGSVFLWGCCPVVASVSTAGRALPACSQSRNAPKVCTAGATQDTSAHGGPARAPSAAPARSRTTCCTAPWDQLEHIACLRRGSHSLTWRPPQPPPAPPPGPHAPASPTHSSPPAVLPSCPALAGLSRFSWDQRRLQLPSKWPLALLGLETRERTKETSWRGRFGALMTC